MEQVCTPLTSKLTATCSETKVCYLCRQLYNCKSSKFETEKNEKQWAEYLELLHCCSEYVWPSAFDERINWKFVMEEKIIQFCRDCISTFEKLFEMNQLLEEMHTGIRDFIESFSEKVLQLPNQNQFLYNSSGESNESISNYISTSERVDRDFEVDLQFSHFTDPFPTTGTTEGDPDIEFKNELIAIDFVDPSDTTDISQLKSTCISNELCENIPSSGVSKPLSLQAVKQSGRNLDTTNMEVKSDLKTLRIVLTQLKLDEVKKQISSKYKSVGDKNIKKSSVSKVCTPKRKAAVAANAAIKKWVFANKKTNSRAKVKDDENSTSDCSDDESLISNSGGDNSKSDIKANLISAMKKLKGDLCKKKSKRRCVLKLHTATDHNALTSFIRENQYKIAKRFNCKCCKFSCSFVKQLSAHTLKTGHENERKYQCPSCSRSFNKVEDLKLHKFRFHNRKKISFFHYRLRNRKNLKCKICEKVFRRKASLSSHYRLLHSPTSIFHECRICNIKFPFMLLLKEHYFNVHSGENHKCKICGKEYTKKYFLHRHRLKHKNWNKTSGHGKAFHHTGYKCRICGKQFKKVDRLHRHRRVHTRIWNIDVTEYPGSKISLKPKCNICDRYFATKEMLRLHSLIHTTFMADKVAFFKYYKCCICDSSFKSKFLLNKHKDHVHSDGNYFECETCESVFETSHALEVHKNVYVNDNEYIKCQMCMYNFHSFVDFTYHFHQQHAKRLPAGKENECGVCDENLKSGKSHNYKYHKGSLLKCKKCGKLCGRHYFPTHWKSHFLTNSFKCGICNISFNMGKELRTHKILCHPREKLFKCTSCDKSYCSKNNLRLHVREHHSDRDKRFCCDFCGKYLASHFSLIDHRRQHTGDLHCCKLCDKKFLRMNMLREHIRFVHEKKAVRCEECGKSFKSQYALKLHMPRHTGDYPFKCNSCGKQYASKSRLNLHSETHSGVKKYSCKICKKSISSKSNLRIHMKTTHGDKRFQCELCGVNFKRRDNLITHMRSHNGEKPYQCQDCGKGFTRLDNLNTHVKWHERTKLKPSNIDDESDEDSEEDC